MTILTRYNTGIAALILMSIAFFILYRPQYSSNVIEPYDINSPELETRVLIASQVSTYKYALVYSIVKHLHKLPAYIKVVDVIELSKIKENDWNAIVIIHTWEYWKPPPEVETWLEQAKDLNKVVVLTTSGNGQYKMKDINAITSASQMVNISSVVDEIMIRINYILNNNTTIQKNSQ